MPVPLVPKTLQRESLGGFRGVNLRQDRLSLADEDVARAINIDFHRHPGVALLRLGSSTQFSTSLGATIRRLARYNSVRYQVAGTVLYANQASLLTGLHSDLFTTLQPLRPLNDTTEWVYIADRSAMKKTNG